MSCGLAAAGLLAALAIQNGDGTANAAGFGNSAPPHGGKPHGGTGQGTGTHDDGTWLKTLEVLRARTIAVGLIREMAIVDQFPPAVYIQFKEIYLDWALVASQADIEPIPFDEWLWQVGIEDPGAFKAFMTFFAFTEVIVDKILSGG